MPEKPLHSSELLLASERVFQNTADFLAHFSVMPDREAQPQQFLEALNQLDPRFQGRQKLVRYKLEQDQRQWPDATKELILQTARRLEMFEPHSPLIGHFDTVIVLSGARQANLDRSRYPLACYENEQTSFRRLVLAGTDRRLGADEQANVANYAPGAETEFDLCAAAAKVLASENPGLDVGIHRVAGDWQGTPEVIGSVLLGLESSGELAITKAVAAVTNQIYRASTELDLARVAKRHGVEQTFAAGCPSEQRIIDSRTPATYLTEIIRTMRAAALSGHSERQ